MLIFPFSLAREAGKLDPIFPRNPLLGELIPCQAVIANLSARGRVHTQYMRMREGRKAELVHP